MEACLDGIEKTMLKIMVKIEEFNQSYKEVSSLNNTIAKMEVAVADVNDQVGIVEQNLEKLGLKGQSEVLKESILNVFNPMIEAKFVENVAFQD